MFITIGGKLPEIIRVLENTLSDHLLHSLLSHQNILWFNLTKHPHIWVNFIFKRIYAEWEWQISRQTISLHSMVEMRIEFNDLIQ